MNFNKLVLGMLLQFLLISHVNTQKVTVSREIGVRNNYAYDILPNIEDHIIFYHDRGVEHNFEIYDKELRYKTSLQPEFEKKNIQPTGVIPVDSAFNFYYSYRDEGKVILRVISFDKNVSIKDSATLAIKDKRVFNSNPRFTFSKDKSKVLIFTPEENHLNLMMVDNRNFNIIYDFNLVVEGVNLKSEFDKITITNDGEIYIITRKSSFWAKKENSGFDLTRIKDPRNIWLHRFSPESDEITDLLMRFDEKNKRIAFAGFTSDGDESKCNGYFGFSILPSEMPDDAEIIINRFSPDLISDITGKKSTKIKELSDITLQDVIIKNDGGLILALEVVREFTRRTQMNGPGQFGNGFPNRGFIDYYHEDMILLSTNAEGSEVWKKTLFKKQFSQDDNAIFSSFFIFKTPSRVRLVYNDEIKNSNTVSEYVLDPNGNAERRSVLSTEYQNLKLRFKDAIQIGPASFIVPSEKSWKINMVKIDFGL